MNRTLVFAFIVFVALRSSAAGQSSPAGLFGATRQSPGARDVLSLQVSVSEAYDSKVPPEAGFPLPPGSLPFGGRSNLFAPDIDYAHEGARLRATAATSGFFRYSYAIDELQPGYARAEGGLEIRMPRTGTLSVSPGLAYYPSYIYETLPVESQPGIEPQLPSSPDYRIDNTESVGHQTRVRFATGSGLGWSIATTADYGAVDYRRAVLTDRTTYGAGSSVSYQPTRARRFSVGYRYRAGEFESNATSGGHELPLGFEYSPAISRSRRLAFRVEVTPTMINAPDTFIEDSPDATADGQRILVQGDAGIEYPFHLKWRFAAGYRRGVDYLSVLSEPVVTDGARMRLSGMMGRRVDVWVQARYAVGTSAFPDGGEHRQTTAQGESRFRFAVSRWFALFSEYAYYFYDFEDQRPQGFELPGQRGLHSVRAGVMLFAQPLR